MSHGLVLVNDGLMALRVLLLDACLSPIVEEELRLIQVFPVSRYEVQPAQSHLRNLVSRHHACLSWLVSNLLDHAVGISDGDVQELPAARSLIVGHGTLDHVSEVIQLVAQVLFLRPSFLTSPVMRVLGVHGSGRIQISVRLLSRSNYVEH